MSKLVSIKTCENKGSPVCTDCPMLLQCEFNFTSEFSNGIFWTPGPGCPVYNSKVNDNIQKALDNLKKVLTDNLEFTKERDLLETVVVLLKELQ